MYIQRFAEDEFLRCSKTFKAVTVYGPRGAGKTTMLKHLAEPERTYVSLDDTDNLILAQTDPDLFFQRYRPPVIIDEAQKAPGLYSYIKLICDETDARSLFWMASSEDYTFHHTDCESLCGRQARVNLYPLSYNEASGIRFTDPFDLTPDHLLSRSQQAGECDAADLFRFIWQGTLPGVQGASPEERREFYENHINYVLLRDARYLAPDIDEVAFRRFLTACATMIGQVIHYSPLALAAGISVPKAKKWVSILSGMRVLYLLHPHQSTDMKSHSRTPVLYFMDTGLASYLAKWPTADTLLAGNQGPALLRNYVITELMKDLDCSSVQYNLEYYKDRGGKELPLIMTWQRDVHPLDIQLAAAAYTSAARRFKAVRDNIFDMSCGGIVCLSPTYYPLGRENHIIPANIL
ncbi:MAG: AAA family ATPase [Clostridia bacterium]|nr:AAA family ATPase [Clostridia bacterium]